MERLVALAAAHRRQRSSDLLILVQAAQCAGEGWEKLQQQLIKELK